MGISAIASPVAISASPAIPQPQNELSCPSINFPHREHKVSNGRSLHSQHGRKRDSVDYAPYLFVELPSKQDMSFSEMIASHSRNGDFIQAFQLFTGMIGEGLYPSVFALASLVMASSTLREKGLSRQLHGWIVRAGFGLEIEIRKALIITYSRYRMLDDARWVFDEIALSYLGDEQLWKSIIVAYISIGYCIEAFRLFYVMLSIGRVRPTELTYTSIMSACSSAREEKYGRAIHGLIIKDGLLEATHMWNSLVSFYAKCGNLEAATMLFERIPRKDVVSWNAIIAANEQMGMEENAIELFRRLLEFGLVQPNRITFLTVITVLSRLAALKCGKEVHACVIRSELEDATTIDNSLINMYSKCRQVEKAEVVFERCLFKDIVTWNSMLAAYEQNNKQERCLETFKKMLYSGTEADSHSFTIVLSAILSVSSRSQYMGKGQEIHGYICRRGTLERLDLSVSNAIISIYAKANRMIDAEKIFKTMTKRDSYSWNAMMDGYNNNGQFEDALVIFVDMIKNGFPIDNLSFSIVITSCSKLVSFSLGKQLHSLATKKFYHHGSAHQDFLLSIDNALISMYFKCGSINDAALAFSRMETRDIFSWTAMITGYAENGLASESLEVFERMKKDGIKPNQVTFLGLLMACAHGGFFEEGTHLMYSMEKDYGLKPSIEHYACMIDLYGRLGKFKCAKNLTDSIIELFEPDPGDILNLWKVLLGACNMHKKLDLGVEAATKILELAPDDGATYVLLSNLYSNSGLWKDASIMRKAMVERGLRKEVGCSWIDIGNKRHFFVAADSFHPQRKEIYDKLGEMEFKLRMMGYKPVTG